MGEAFAFFRWAVFTMDSGKFNGNHDVDWSCMGCQFDWEVVSKRLTK